MKQILIVLLGPILAMAQPGTISTFAGAVSDDGNALLTPFTFPGQLAIDPSGNIYVTDSYSLVKIDTNQQSSRLIRSTGSMCGDGTIDPAIPHRVASGMGIAVDSTGTVAFANLSCGHLMRMTAPGRATPLFDITSYGAGLSSMTYDSAGVLYVIQSEHNQVLAFDQNGYHLVAGNGASGFSGDGGKATDAQFNNPQGIAVDGGGNVYIADSGNFRIRQITPDGIIQTIAGTGTNGYDASGPAVSARLGYVNQLAVDASGGVVFIDLWNRRVRRIGPDGNISTIAGTGVYDGTGDGGPALQAAFKNPTGIAAGSDGSIYISDSHTATIRKIDSTGTINRYAGLPVLSGNGGPAAFAQLTWLNVMAFEAGGSALLIDWNKIRRIGVDGNISVVFDAQTQGINISNHCLATLSDGSILFCGEHAIYRLDPTGQMTVIAGTPTVAGYSGDGGPAVNALLNLLPGGSGFSVVTDSQDQIYFTQNGSSVIRRITADGTIDTIAGNGTQGFSGDGGPATQAQFNLPSGLALDGNGNLYVADSANNRIRKIDPQGVVTTVYGNGKSGEAQLGKLATESPLSYPKAVAVDSQGNLFVVGQDPIVFRLGQSGLVYRFAGSDSGVTSGDGGPAVAATLYPFSLAFDFNGNVFVSDQTNGRIRKIEGSSSFSATPASLSFGLVPGAPGAPQDLTISSSDGDPHSFFITADASWIQIPVASGSVSAARSVVVRISTAAFTKSGYYQAKITIADRNSSAKLIIPVVAVVSSTPQQMRLGKTGLVFSTIQNSAGVPATQTLPVLNTGLGSMTWNATASTLSGSNWLALASNQGTSTVGQIAPTIAVSVNPGALPAGIYYGLVTAKSSQADNSPQSAIVVLEVNASADQPVIQADPGGLIFVATDTGTAPQVIRLFNPAGSPQTYSISLTYPTSDHWVLLSGTQGTLAAGEAREIPVSPQTGNLSPGVFTAVMNVKFSPANTTLSINLVLVNRPVSGAQSRRDTSTGSCRATRLLPVFRSPGSNFNINGGWPLPVDLLVYDDCGAPNDSGRVIVSGSGVATTLTPIGNGHWTGTATASGSGTVVLSASVANSDSPALVGTATLLGKVQGNAVQPVIDQSGIRNLVRPVAGAPIAVGGLVKLTGVQFASDSTPAPDGAWPVAIADTKVYIAGQPMPLHLISPGSIEGIVPSGVAENTPHQVVVQRGNAYSPPQDILVTTVAPSLVSIDGTGGNQGAIYVTDSDGNSILADGGHPVQAGDTIVIQAAGLGMTSPPVDPGQATPQDPPSVVQQTVIVTIEGQGADVSEATLVPGLVGIYRIVATVPVGIGTTSSARLTVGVNGITSDAVTLAIQQN